MSTIFQWVHVGAAVIGVGGICFLAIVLLPSLSVLSAEQRDQLAQTVMRRFRWVSWTAIALLVFAISLAVTLPLNFLERFLARRRLWLTLAFALALVVILISAYSDGPNA